MKGKEKWLAQDEGVERSSKREEEAFLAELEQQGPRPREVHLGLRRQMCSVAPPSPHPPLPHLVAHRYKKKLGRWGDTGDTDAEA